MNIDSGTLSQNKYIKTFPALDIDDYYKAIHVVFTYLHQGSEFNTDITIKENIPNEINMLSIYFMHIL